MNLSTPLDVLVGIYIGLPKYNGIYTTGIDKESVLRGAVSINGIIGDNQGYDKHIKESRALHHYPSKHYSFLVDKFKRDDFYSGSLGENLVSLNLCEKNVYIGDIYKIGRCGVMVQVTMPRIICFKPNDKFKIKGLSRYLTNKGMTGWFYRVIRDGIIEVGSRIELMERGNLELRLDKVQRLAQDSYQNDPDLVFEELCLQDSILDIEWKNLIISKRNERDKEFIIKESRSRILEGIRRREKSLTFIYKFLYYI